MTLKGDSKSFICTRKLTDQKERLSQTNEKNRTELRLVYSSPW